MYESPNFFVVSALVFTVLVTLVVYKALATGADRFGVTLFGKSFFFPNPIREDSYFTAAPFIQPVNEFLVSFANAPEVRIEFTSEDIKAGSSTPVLRALYGIEYDRVRLRLRIISNLDPVVNVEAEEGIIRFTSVQVDGAQWEVKLRSTFAPYGRSIMLEKL